MKAIPFIIFLLLTFTAFSRPPKVKWEKFLGGSSLDIAKSVRQTSDHGFIIGGSSQSTDGDVAGNHGSSDCWVVKLDSVGKTEWEKSYGGSGWDELSTIRLTSDGGYIFAGRSCSNDGDVTGHHGTKWIGDVWVVKLDNNGNIQWEHSYGGTSEENAFDILQTFDGGYAVAAATWSNDGNVTGHHGTDRTSDYWIIKLDPGGNIEWEKCYGGGANEQPCTILQGSDGGFFIAGYSTSSNGDVSKHHGTVWVHNVWIVKLHGNGELIDAKVMPNSLDQTPFSACFSKEGGYIIAGSGNGFPGHKIFDHGSGDLMLMKLNKDCRLDTACDLGSTSLDVAYAITPTADGGYAVAGTTEGDFWVLKFDSILKLQWEKDLGGTGIANAIQQTDEGGYIVVGQISGDHNSTDFYVVKLIPTYIESDMQTQKEKNQNPIPYISLLTNPATNTIKLNCITSGYSMIELDDLTGRTFLTKSIDPGNQNISINVSEIPKGFYLVILITPEGEITKKIKIDY